MTEILVRDLDPIIVTRLKARARMHGRSLQKEIKLILEQSAPVDCTQALALSEKWQSKLGGRSFSDSTDQLREDRNR